MRIETLTRLEECYGNFERQTSLSFLATIIEVKDVLSDDEESSQLIPCIITRNKTDGDPIGQYPILDKGRTFHIGQTVEITPIKSIDPSIAPITFFDIE